MLPDSWWVAIHKRLKAGDPTATAELAENALDLLCHHLRCRFPVTRDQDFIDDAATETLVSYMKRPDQYNPLKMKLRGYLEMAAEADLQNAFDKEKRRREREPHDSGVELSEIVGKESSGEGEAEDCEAGELTRAVCGLFKDPADQQLARLVIERERSTEKFAAVLGITHLPVAEQRQIVKRRKDRIKKILHARGRNQYE